MGFSPDQFKPTNAEASFQRGDVTVYSALGYSLKFAIRSPHECLTVYSANLERNKIIIPAIINVYLIVYEFPVPTRTSETLSGDLGWVTINLGLLIVTFDGSSV